MEQEETYVGIDVAKAQVDVAIRPADDRWRVSHDEAGIRQLVSRLKTLEPVMVLLEASGGLELPLVAALAAEAVPVVVVNRVRLSLFVLAYNLGNFLRRLCLPKAVKHWSLRSVQVKLIKMGGRLVRHARRLIFQLSEVSVPRRLFQGVLDRIGRLSPAPS